MPTLKVGEKTYTLKTAPGKEHMSLFQSEKAGQLDSRLRTLEEDWLKSLDSGEVGDKEEKFQKAWLDFCASVFVEEVSSLALENLLESEVLEIKNFFTEAWGEANPQLLKLLKRSDASSPAPSQSTPSPEGTKSEK